LLYYIIYNLIRRRNVCFEMLVLLTRI